MCRYLKGSFATKISCKQFLLLLLCSILLLNLPAVQAAADKNHYIIIFDASGSTYNIPALWHKGYSSTQMADRLREVMRQSLTLQQDGYEPYQEGDYLSFALFNLHYYEPSYLYTKMFLSNRKLILRESMPNAADFKWFDNTSAKRYRKGSDCANTLDSPKSQINLSCALSGFSPLIAASKSIFPFLQHGIDKYQLPYGRHNAVKNTYLIRITDGRYNAVSNGSDEYSVISDLAKGRGIDSISDYPSHRTLAQDVDASFSPNTVAECAFLPGRGPSVSDTLNCSENAYELVSDVSKGLYITYFNVVAKGFTSLTNQVYSENRDVKVTREIQVKNGYNEVVYAVNNRVKVSDYTDAGGRSLLHTAELFIPGQPVQTCMRNQDDQLLCDGNENVLLRDMRDNFPEQIKYNFQYRKIMPGTYPLAYQFPDYPVTVTLRPADAEFYYPLPRKLSDDSLLYLNPLRVTNHFLKEPPAIPLDDEMLLQPAIIEILEKENLTSSAEFAQYSQVSKNEYLIQEKYAQNVARILWSSIGLLSLACIALCIWYYPHRKLGLQYNPVVKGAQLIDFNSRTHESIVLMANLMVLNKKKTRREAVFPLTVNCAVNEDYEVNGKQINNSLLIDKSPFSIQKPGNLELQDKHAKQGIEYPIYFSPAKILDCKLPETEKVQVSVTSSIEGNSGKFGQCLESAQLTLYLIPEAAKFKFEAPQKLALDDEGMPMLAMEYVASEKPMDVLNFAISNNTQYKFSKRAKGKVVAQLVELKSQRKLKGAILLAYAGTKPDVAPLAALSYDLGHQEQKQVHLLLDTNLLENPEELDQYRIELTYYNSDGEQTMQGHYLIRLLISRSSETTDIFVDVIPQLPDVAKRLTADINKVRVNSGSNDHPVRIVSYFGQGKLAVQMLQLDLVNRCKSGIGLARWKMSIVTKMEGMSCSGLLVRNHRMPYAITNTAYSKDTIIQTELNGELVDGLDLAKREHRLTVGLDHESLNIFERSPTIQMQVKIQWQHELQGDTVAEYEHNAMIHCQCLHIPPKNLLAIDTGTSAYAAALAIGEDTETIDLNQRRITIAQETGMQTMDESDNFINAMCNIHSNAKTLSNLRPTDAGFIQLPASRRIMGQKPENAFIGIKALFAAGITHLPNTGKNRYKESFSKPVNGEPKLTSRDPKLTDVMKGIYEGFKQNYINPEFSDRNSDFYYLYATHPNTYTPSHVNVLRKVLENVYATKRPSGQILYKENIRLVSESDAIALYYILDLVKNCAASKDWTSIPAKQSYMVYDIGAGTLDMSHLVVHWRTNDDNSKSPQKIQVKQRAGVNKAGNLLDECIIRDIHELIKEELGAELDNYVSPLVSKSVKTLSKNKRTYLHLLKKEILLMKKAFGLGTEEFTLQLHFEDVPEECCLRTALENTPELYLASELIQGTDTGDVSLRIPRDKILNGTFTKEFIEDVTQNQIQSFFQGKVPDLDVVIVSGRTSLFHGFNEALQKSFPKVKAWADFDGNAEKLKSAVVEGVIKFYSRWPGIELTQTTVVGQVGIVFEKGGPDDWHFVPLESGQTERIKFNNANQLKFGIQNNNGFQTSYSVAVKDFCVPGNTELGVTIEYDQSGLFRASVENSAGTVIPVTEDEFLINNIDFNAQPWPLGNSKLIEKTPEQVLSA